MPRSQNPAGGAGGGSGETLPEKLSRLFLKPADPAKVAAAQQKQGRRSVEEAEYENRYANDKERLIGLVVAPVAALIALITTSALIAHNPVKGSKDYTNPSLYTELMLVLLALAVVMLLSAWFRKRLYFGIATALYGLAIFNMHYWGFGFPFIFVAAWYLVRAYRAQQAVKEAKGEGRFATPSGGVRPDASKRYTPPTTNPRRRSSGSKREGDQKAG